MDVVADAMRAIDHANSGDPGLYDGEPLALVQGRLAHGWVLSLDPDASAALRLAARAHHLRRWVVPRASYPEGRPGYLRWRRDQKTRHADELQAILTAAGVDAVSVARASTIVAKTGFGTDPEVQVFEDAVCLTFLQTQLASTAQRLGKSRVIEVVAKSLAKMSDDAAALATTIDLDADAVELIARAVERHLSPAEPQSSGPGG